MPGGAGILDRKKRRQRVDNYQLWADVRDFFHGVYLIMCRERPDVDNSFKRIRARDLCYALWPESSCGINENRLAAALGTVGAQGKA
jgi:hypothetical protein